MSQPRPTAIEPPLEVDERGPYLPDPDHNFVSHWVDADKVTDEEFADLVELFGRAFNGGPSWFHYGVAPIDHMRWKTVDAPVETAVILRFLLDGGDGKPFSTGFGTLQRYLVEGVERAAHHNTDAATEPSMQGRGIQSALNRQVRVTRRVRGKADLGVGWGVAHPIWDHLRQTRKDGEERVEAANRLIPYARPLSWAGLRRRRPARPEQAGTSRTRDVIRGYRRKIGARQVTALGRGLVRAGLHRVRLPRGVRGDWQIESVQQFGSEADAFWAEASTQFDFLQIRDREYLNWRYLDRRAGPFEVRVAMSEGRMLGYVAIRATAGEAVIADVLALPGRTDVVGALIDDAMDLARQAGSPTMRLWLFEHHPYTAAVRDRGFFDTDQGLALSVRRYWDDSPEVRFLDDPEARLHVGVGDSDHI